LPGDGWKNVCRAAARAGRSPGDVTLIAVSKTQPAEAVREAFAAGLRLPYSRWSDAVLTFLRDVCEPYLRLFRRVLPSFGGLDFSPIIAIVLLQLAGSLISRAIR